MSSSKQNTLFTSIMNINPLRWSIYSFTPVSDYRKIHEQKYAEVVKQIHTYFMKKRICLSISEGRKKVCTDLEEPCVMCYYYGYYDPEGVCLYHLGQEPDTYISYVYYKKIISIYSKETYNDYLLIHIDDYVEFRLQRDILEDERRDQDFYY